MPTCSVSAHTATVAAGTFTVSIEITGTDNVPVLGHAIGRAPLGTTTGEYAGLGTPSVWRNARSRVDAMASNGMDEIDIPAFLRKQAD